MTSINRRGFITRTSALAATTAFTAPNILLRSVSAHELQDGGEAPVAPPEVRIGVAGLNGQGNNLTNFFRKQPGVRITALCDVDSRVLSQREAQLKEAGIDVRTFGDFREMIDGDTIDAVVIATPNHWHALMAVWACDAGKDVYVEKPVSHVISEGRSIVDAASRTGRVVQSGMHGRSSHAVRSAVEYARSGELGKVVCARGLCYKPRRSIGKVQGTQFVPHTIDYHRWLGPAPYEPLNRRRLHYDWHWYDKTGNGDLGNQGVHQMDIARWGAGHDRLPDRAWSAGGRVGYDDDGNTPNTQVVVLEYDDGPPIIFEVRGLPRDKAQQSDKWQMDQHHGMDIGVVLHCEGGEVRISKHYGHTVALDGNGAVIKEWKGGGSHHANFLDAVRASDSSRLNAPIIDGHLSAAAGHLGLVSHELGEPGTLRDALDTAPTPEAHEAVDRMNQHMLANGVSEDGMIVVGRPVPVDAANERSTDRYANALFTKQFREPFTMPS